MNVYKGLYNFVHGDRPPLPFFSACRNRQTCFAAQSRVPISRKFIQKYIFGVGCAAVPLQVRLTGLGIPGRHFGSSRRGPKPLQFQIEMPVVARAQFEPS